MTGTFSHFEPHRRTLHCGARTQRRHQHCRVHLQRAALPCFQQRALVTSIVDKRWGNLSTMHNLVNRRLHNPASFGNHRAASHLVGKWARMRKIFLFGAGLSGVNPRSPDACSARPGLLQIGDSLDSAIWTESTPPRCPEREYFAHSGGKNDNMPPRNSKGTPEPKNNAPRVQACTELPKHRPLWCVCRQGSSRTATLWIS